MDTEKLKRDFQLRQQARQRLPGWAKAIVILTYLCFTLGIAFLSFVMTIVLRTFLRPELGAVLPAAGAPPTVTFIVVLIVSFAIGTTAAIVPANVFCWLILPLRKILDENSKNVRGMSFSEGIRAGKRAALFVATPGLLILAIIAWAPWL